MGQGPLPQEAVPKLRPEAGRVGPGVGVGRLRREVPLPYQVVNGMHVPGMKTIMSC